MIKLPNYKILKQLGSGGMGDVYLAEHTLIKRKVAIKILHPHLTSNKAFIKRFRKEAELLASLDHPNIVRLNEYFEHEGGLFLVMEYVEGMQLDDYIKNVSGLIPEEKLIPLFQQLVSAIGYAHKKNLIHRDIKPSNIIINNGMIKVLDFGIAKLLTEDHGMTKTGVQVGTVMYMSPEQVNAEEVDLRTDIYSLGVTFFQMAVGKAPYVSDTNTFKIQVSIVNDPFPNAKDIYPSISNKLVAIIEKATQKDKADRYQDCEEFKNDLNARSVKRSFTTPSKLPKLPKLPVNKLPYLWYGKILFGILLSSVILFGIISFFQSDDESDYIDHFYKAEEYYDDRSYQSAVDELNQCLLIHSEVDSVLVLRGRYYIELKEFTKSIDDLSRAIALNPDIPDRYLYRGNANYKLGKLNQAIDDYTKAIKLRFDYAKAYRNRGIARYESCKNGACDDLRKAGNLGDSQARKEYKRIRGKSECK